MLNQLPSVFNPSSLYLPQNLPILQKCGRVNTSLCYRGLNTQGEFTEYEVKRAVASVVAQGFTFANVPYAFFQPVGEENGWQVFRAECGEARIPVSDYRRLLSISKRTGAISRNGSVQSNANHFTKEESMNQSNECPPTVLTVSPEQEDRIRAFILHKADDLNGLLTNEQRQTAAAFLDGKQTWYKNLAGIYRLENGRLMLYPDPEHAEKMRRYPRLRFLANKFRMTADFEPVDVTEDDESLSELAIHAWLNISRSLDAQWAAA